MQIATEVMKAHPAQFDMAGQKLTTTLYTVDEVISQGLAHRLVRYAERALDSGGFADMTKAWSVSVYTVDGDEKPADRSYCVRWQNEKGGYIEVVGILTHKGWPSLDHGFEIGQE